MLQGLHSTGKGKEKAQFFPHLSDNPQSALAADEQLLQIVPEVRGRIT